MEEPEMQLKLQTNSQRACMCWPTSPLWPCTGSRSTSGDHFQSSLSTSWNNSGCSCWWCLLQPHQPPHSFFQGCSAMFGSVLSSLQSDMQTWEEQSQGAIYTVEYACSAIKSMTDSSVYFKSIDSLLKHAIAMKDQLNAAQGRSAVAPQAKNPPGSS
ncbi:BLOC-1-related complex subunit 8 isoform X1 [Coturnix japonica]|uniref:BLOC-1-related complex subunit 8 isoform X1 n=1 Tax=Coturnix japonica TaxID=93934 RepID=UPI0013A5C7C9|nr:BLOC-1-related complex subunit 8 isoform X1 [Coturnix japonica]